MRTIPIANLTVAWFLSRDECLFYLVHDKTSGNEFALTDIRSRLRLN